MDYFHFPRKPRVLHINSTHLPGTSASLTWGPYKVGRRLCSCSWPSQHWRLLWCDVSGPELDDSYWLWDGSYTMLYHVRQRFLLTKTYELNLSQLLMDASTRKHSSLSFKASSTTWIISSAHCDRSEVSPSFDPCPVSLGSEPHWCGYKKVSVKRQEGLFSCRHRCRVTDRSCHAFNIVQSDRFSATLSSQDGAECNWLGNCDSAKGAMSICSRQELCSCSS